MRIAQIAPLYEAVPPKMYGEAERVVSYLTEELVRQGHDVTLFASGDSLTSAQLVPCWELALRLDASCQDTFIPHMLAMKEVFDRLDDFDVLHFHTDYLHFPFTYRQQKAIVTTMHGRLDLTELQTIYQSFSEVPLISISQAQRQALHAANWVGTVYHGLPENLYHLNLEPEDYLAFLGCITPEKRADRAIAIAKASGMKLKIAAKVDPADQQYFDEEIKPLLDHPLIEFLGEIGERQKQEFLGRARALLFPNSWREPYSLAVIEAMACGTPVIAFHNGSAAEIVEQGETGYAVRSQAEALDAINCLPLLSRRRCRDLFLQRFSVSRMAHDYLAIYEGLAEGLKTSKKSLSPASFRSDLSLLIPAISGT